ncbi:hypothetical protein ACN27F_22345 [Solwaraspora sp. WMMB335]|uniref:hypothetical protein n=1 Tax=Solwaraspora sp. WMMB335 TaxID=3404118 RepID=UPI003B9284AA
MKRHHTDGVSLAFALVFLAIVGWWITARYVHLALPEIGWIVAAGLILLGVAGLIGALRSGRSAGRENMTDPTDTEPGDTAPGDTGLVGATETELPETDLTTESPADPTWPSATSEKRPG